MKNLQIHPLKYFNPVFPKIGCYNFLQEAQRLSLADFQKMILLSQSFNTSLKCRGGSYFKRPLL